MTIKAATSGRQIPHFGLRMAAAGACRGGAGDAADERGGRLQAKHAQGLV
ncbi:MAG: hypothetical protein U1E05_19895 [Patescibacteria group bacterium]|nr:hypothetical protein [Patescibacteria group bacterium]